MGSKTPEGHETLHDRKDADIKPARPDVKGSRNNSASADLDRGIVGEDGDDDSDGEAGLNAPVAQSLENKKKKRKKSKTKRSKGKVDLEQTTPPTIPVADLFPSGYPTGQLVPHENLSRTTDEEKRYNSRLWDDGFLSDYRQAAEIHRQVRQYAQKEVIKPGATLQTIAEAIENGVYALTGHQGLEAGDGLKAGMGFPAGLCLNNVAAHWTPNPGGKDVVLQPSDVLKVDFGVHVNGRIVDSAFTASFDPTYDNLLEAVKAATNIGIAHAGVDARISDISAAIQEVMESYEVEIGRKTFPVKAVRNITGHDILQYRIHGNKQIPFIKNDSQQKMEEGEVFAIETFGSTDKAFLDDDIGIYGYGRNPGVSGHNLQPTAKSLLKTIDANFGTLVFCRRYLERLGVKKYHLGMKQLVDQGIVSSYGPLVDKKGSYVAQWEHTILLHSGGKEVISRGEDY